MSCNCVRPVCGTQQATTFSCTDNDGRDVEFVGLEEFLPRVSLVAKGVPDDVALEYIRQSAHKLARNARVLKRDLYLDVQAGVRDYYLNAGDMEQVFLIDRVEYQNKDKSLCDCFMQNSNRPPRLFRFEPPDKIILHKAPKEDGESKLHVHYYAMPTQNACDVDRLLFDRYHDVVVNGALSDLLLMRQYSFADPQMALFYQKEQHKGIAMAKIDFTRQYQTGFSSLAYKGCL